MRNEQTLPGNVNNLCVSPLRPRRGCSWHPPRSLYWLVYPSASCWGYWLPSSRELPPGGTISLKGVTSLPLCHPESSTQLSHPECKELVLLPPFRARYGAPRDLAEAGLHLGAVPSLFLLPSLPFSWRVWPQISSALEALLEAKLRALKPRPPLAHFLAILPFYFLLLFYSVTSVCPFPLLLLIENEVLILNKCTEPALSGAGTCTHSTLKSCPAI